MKTELAHLPAIERATVSSWIHDHQGVSERLVEVTRDKERDAHFFERVHQTQHSAKSEDGSVEMNKRMHGDVRRVKMGILLPAASTGFSRVCVTAPPFARISICYSGRADARESYVFEPTPEN